MKPVIPMIFAGLVLLSTPSMATGLNGFACEFSLGEGDNSIRQVVLNESVYRCLRHWDYADLAVVNNRDEAVPWRLVEFEGPSDPVFDERPILFFTEPAPAAFETGDQLRRIAQLTGLSTATMDEKQWQKANSYYSSVILERTEPLVPLRQISIDVSRQGDPVTVTLMVERSPDLKHWTTLTRPQELRFLGQGDRELHQNTLTLNAPKQAKYLRLAMLSSVKDFAGDIDRVVGHYEKAESATEGLQLQWLKVPEFQELDGEGAWAIQLPGLFPVARLRFTPAPGRLFYTGSIYVRSLGYGTAKEPSQALYEEGRERVKTRLKAAFKGEFPGGSDPNAWRYKTHFNTYWLTTEAGSLSHSDVDLALTHSEHWKFVFDQSDELTKAQLPRIEFGWQPRTIRFFAQGQGPFKLKVGRDSPAPRPSFPAGLDINTAQSVSLLQATSNTQSTVIEKDSFWSGLNWNKLLLWALLLAGLSLLSVMAYRLWRAMDADR